MSPLAVGQAGQPAYFVSLFPPITFCGVAAVMGSLEVAPVLRSRFRRFVSELSPSADGPDLVDHEAQRMLGVAGLIVADRPQASATDPARCSHGPEGVPILPPEVSICVSRVAAHNQSFTEVEVWSSFTIS